MIAIIPLLIGYKSTGFCISIKVYGFLKQLGANVDVQFRLESTVTFTNYRL